jgi:hypothetical protein
VIPQAHSFGISIAITSTIFNARGGRTEMSQFSLTQFYGVNKNTEGQSEMSKNIEQYVASGQVEGLLKYCDSCLYKIFDERILVSECGRCSIQTGIDAILNGHASLRKNRPAGNS